MDEFLIKNVPKEMIITLKKMKYKKMMEVKEIDTICGSEIFINYLIENKYNYCVVTNTTSEIVNHYKKHNQLISKIENIITREDYKESKPSDECWKVALIKYNKDEKYIIGIENTLSGYESLKSVTNYIYILKSLPIIYSMDTYLFDNYKQIIS